jgi:outer membrane protein
MKSLFACGAAAALALLPAAPAVAQESNGRFQIKGFVTAVLPDGEITDVRTDAIGLPAGSQVSASDSYVPSVAIEYFVTPSFSLETICCVTPHDVEGEGALAGAALIDDAIILPATVTGKYHWSMDGGFKPYVGAGVTHFFIFSEDVGRDAAALGATDADLSDEFGFVLQAGFDLPLNDSGLGFSLDAKRYFVDTTATFRAGSATALQTEHALDPWVVSAGVSYRF